MWTFIFLLILTTSGNLAEDVPAKEPLHPIILGEKFVIKNSKYLKTIDRNKYEGVNTNLMKGLHNKSISRRV